MELVSRLKMFIDHLSIPVTQFADSCGIPRPSFSQLLNGRNKKVSDEVIGKIHEAYPRLSVLWLMFGEGDMLKKENIEISEPQNEGIFAFSQSEQPTTQQVMSSFDFENDITENEPEKFKAAEINVPEVKATPIEFSAPANSENDTADGRSTISFEPYAKKKIVNIIVYYDDNSFESFVPGARK